jgi:bifunctional DNA-binding transcriptional regulator/antitoxin component of YhaV-PrlF toxin-antitoxin module
MERTKVVLAQSESKSLRTTIPAGIARQFKIAEGSEIGWEIEARDNQLVIVVTPLPYLEESMSLRERALARPPPRKKTETERSE